MLIFGKFGAPALGVEGAAAATLVARVVEVIILIISIYKSNGVFKATLKELTDINLDFLRNHIRLSFQFY